MSRINRPAILNRSTSGVLGVLGIGAGALAVAAHYGRLGWLRPDATIVPGVEPPPLWVMWTAVAGCVLITTLCVWWLLAQLFRTPRSCTWRIDGVESAGKTALESSVAAAPVVRDIESYGGVRSASAWLTGAHSAPELYLVVTIETHADIVDVRRRILGHAIARLREALQVKVIPVSLEVDFAEDREPARVDRVSAASKS
ncbi:alkaline shock response membrane anchor protein AmaP [Nocardia sp. NPDC057668]|uniref:alkaline shock response membrane anchor protein AmaP n=1 Tax=Nocardia sp. NPDC057668 TaxID=3346202 RepID=UPI00366CD493